MSRQGRWDARRMTKKDGVLLDIFHSVTTCVRSVLPSWPEDDKTELTIVLCRTLDVETGRGQGAVNPALRECLGSFPLLTDEQKQALVNAITHDLGVILAKTTTS